MSLRTLGKTQLGFGLLLVILGIVGLGSSLALVRSSNHIAQAVSVAAAQSAGTADACEKTLPLLDDLDRTSQAVRASLGTMRTSLDELAKHEDRWRTNAKNLGESLAGLGDKIRDFGALLDFNFPSGLKIQWDKKAGVPYPSAVEVVHSQPLHKIAEPMRQQGTLVGDAGREVKATSETLIQEFARNRGPLGKALEQGAAGLQDLSAAVREMRANGAPATIANLRSTRTALDSVATQIPVAGWFGVVLALSIVIGGILCICNGLALSKLELRDRPLAPGVADKVALAKELVP